MLVFRFLATLCFLIAAIALVSDLTPAVYGVGPATLHAFSTHLADLMPRSLETVESAISNATSPLVWSYIIAPLMALPTAILFAAFGAFLGYLGRRRGRVNVYAN